MKLVYGITDQGFKRLARTSQVTSFEDTYSSDGSLVQLRGDESDISLDKPITDIYALIVADGNWAGDYMREPEAYGTMINSDDTVYRFNNVDNSNYRVYISDSGTVSWD